VKEEIGWNDQEKRAVEPEERDNEDGMDFTMVQGGRRDPRAYTHTHIYIYIYIYTYIYTYIAQPRRVVFLGFVPGRLPLILQTANNTPRIRRFVRERNGTLY